MKISYNWLKQYINVELDPERIAEILTSIGLEVENLEKHQAVKGGLEGVVIGEVLTCEKHPDADKLSCTTVNVGSGEPLPIVCGAPNVAKGQKVLVATVGTTLYFGDDEVKIKKAKLRGQPSEGMICAEDELGLGKSHDGIMVLPADAVVGTPAKEYFKLEDDYQFEIGLTPNRIDAASHFGVARDLAAYLSQESEVKALRPSVDSFKVDDTSRTIPVEVKNAEACPRYTGVTISNVKVAPSPEWLQNRLRVIGLNPINNIVDITNFVLHEIGQPLHAFDADKIEGGKVVVGTLPEATPFVTLDGQERKLNAEDLMICNATKGMCIAGVFGGSESGVTENTNSVFLESAHFNPVWVRKTARRHGLNTDASFRFERGSDPNITVWALKRAAMLIKEIAGGEISSEIFDVYPTPVKDFDVTISLKRVTSLIGKEIPLATIKRILKGLDIEVVSESGDTLQLAVPPYRVDVQREADVVEEILRIYGYNNIEIPEKVNASLSYSTHPDKNKIVNLASDYLTGMNFNEIMCNSLTKASYYDGLTTFTPENVVKILNPLSNDLNGMRQTLLFGGLATIQRNINHKSPNLKLYEFGNCYKFTNIENADNALKKYTEELRMGIWITGDRAEETWTGKSQQVSFFMLKGYVNALLKRFGYDADSLEAVEAPEDVFDYGLQLMDNGKPVVWFGLVNSKLRDALDIKPEVFFAEIRWDLLTAQAGKVKIALKEIARFPEVRRDLALLIDSNVEFAQVRKIAFATERKLLKRVNLFDVYQGANLGANKKSYAVSFTLQDETKTLTDNQIDKTMDNLVKAFQKEIGAQLR